MWLPNLCWVNTISVLNLISHTNFCPAGRLKQVMIINRAPQTPALKIWCVCALYTHTHSDKDAVHGTHLARVEVHLDVLKRGNRLLVLLLWLLLLLLLLALSARVHCMLGLLVERIGWGRLSWHVAGIQSNSLHRTKEPAGVTKDWLQHEHRLGDLKWIYSDCCVITQQQPPHQSSARNNRTSVLGYLQ